MNIYNHVGDKPAVDKEKEGSLNYNLKDDTLYIQNKKQIIPIKENAWASRSGPKAYVSPWVITWSETKESLPNSRHYFDCSDERGIIILQDGQYSVTYRHRSNTDEDIYGTLSGNLDRYYLAEKPDGVFFHDHAFHPKTSYTSTYVGFIMAGVLISGGPIELYKDLVWYGPEDYHATLTIIKL